MPPEAFAATLESHNIVLRRVTTDSLQVNIGLLCNQVCRHCHLEAGPGRMEAMDRPTMDEVISYAGRCRFDTIDVTGGAPELLPGIDYLLEGLAPHCRKLLLRSNLTALAEGGNTGLIDLCRTMGVSIFVSFPSTSSSQTRAQRGEGVWDASIAMLRELNRSGYGHPDTGLDLNLVVNPAGAFLPADQCQLEKKFKRDLEQRWGVVFSRLFSFANVPLGRFRRWLVTSGNYDQYIGKLSESFNPDAIPGLMCRTLVSVSWDGYLYDCDFNQAAGLPLGKTRSHVSNFDGPPSPGSLIAVGDHCFACTAGSGFT